MFGYRAVTVDFTCGNFEPEIHGFTLFCVLGRRHEGRAKKTIIIELFDNRARTS